MNVTALRAAIVAALPLFNLICLSAAVAAEGPLAQQKGKGGSEIQGSAGPGGSQGDNGLEHCDDCPYTTSSTTSGARSRSEARFFVAVS